MTSGTLSDDSPFLVRLGVDAVLNRRWKLEDLVPGTSGLRRDAESPLDEDDRSNEKRIVTPGTSGLRRDPDYSRPAGGSRRPAKVLKK